MASVESIVKYNKKALLKLEVRKKYFLLLEENNGS